MEKVVITYSRASRRCFRAQESKPRLWTPRSWSHRPLQAISSQLLVNPTNACIQVYPRWQEIRWTCLVTLFKSKRLNTYSASLRVFPSAGKKCSPKFCMKVCLSIWPVGQSCMNSVCHSFSCLAETGRQWLRVIGETHRWLKALTGSVCGQLFESAAIRTSFTLEVTHYDQEHILMATAEKKKTSMLKIFQCYWLWLSPIWFEYRFCCEMMLKFCKLESNWVLVIVVSSGLQECRNVTMSKCNHGNGDNQGSHRSWRSPQS